MNCESCKSTIEGEKAPLHGLCYYCASAVLEEALEVFAPFYLHGKALKSDSIMNLAPLKAISTCGASALVGGAFLSAINFYEKYGVRKCPKCGSVNPRIDCQNCGNGAVGHE
jgi:hypothetical protein